MATTVSDHFIIQYKAEMHIKFQQLSAFYTDTVMTEQKVEGNQVRFLVLSAINAVQKARHAEFTFIDPEHTTVTLTLEDWHVPVPIEDMDQLKTNVNFRTNYIAVSAAAAVRKSDEILITAISTGNTSTSGTSTTRITFSKAVTAIKNLDSNNVPSGDRWALVSPSQWANLHGIPEFAQADFIGSDLPIPGFSRAKNWLGVNWRMATNVPGVGTSNESCFMFHRDAVGLGIGKNITPAFNFIPMRDSWLVNHKLSMGAVVVDPLGVTVMPCSSTFALGT